MTGRIITRYFTNLTSISYLHFAYSQSQSRNANGLKATMATKNIMYYHKILCKIHLYELSPTRPISKPGPQRRITFHQTFNTKESCLKYTILLP
jgi:hypothetical protein